MSCESYDKQFFDKYRVPPEYAKPPELRDFIFEHFDIVERNLQNRKFRETSEGIQIILEKPEINKQFEHKSTKLLTTFHNSTFSKTLTTGLNFGTI